MLQSLARASFRHRKRVILAWIGLVVGLFLVAQVTGTGFRTAFSLPGSESQAAFDLLEAEGFDTRTGNQGQVVFQADDGVRAPVVQAAMESLFAVIETGVEGVEVASPYEPGGERQIGSAGDIAYAELNFSGRTEEEYADAGAVIREHVEALDAPAGLVIELGGDMFVEPPPFTSEFVGLAAAVIILLIAFGSLLAMGLPIVTALFGVAAGVAIVLIATRFMAVPNFTTPAVAMVGIGVGIDYALLIVTRFRENLKLGDDAESAVARAIDTAGRAVIFAGLTVVVAVLGLLLMRVGTGSVAVGISAGVLMVMLASITLLPALLGFARDRIDRFGLPHRGRHHGLDANSFWHRWSRLIQRRPLPMALGGLAILLVLSAPVFAMRLGFADAGNRPESDTTRRAYDLISEGFGPGVNGPLVIAARLSDDTNLAALAGLRDRIEATEGVAAVLPPQPNAEGSAAMLLVFPATSPQDEAMSDLVHHLRDEVIPSVLGGSAGEVYVGGSTAAALDFSEYTWNRMPLFFGAVLALSFVLLMFVFRSVLVPLKAVFMNLLSISAAFGVLVAVFQWGWGAELLGVGKEGPIEAWIPMMMFAIVFGLSMDYEVFLLSRIREHYTRTGNNAEAVANGLAATARVITAAAAIMICVFGAFALGDDHALKLFGFGLAVAIFVDATIVRLILVPATMELLGDWNWWLPSWLERRMPAIHVEGLPGPESEPVPVEARA